MKSIIMIIALSVLLTSCQTTANKSGASKSQSSKVTSRNYKGKSCRIGGRYNWKSSNKTLTRRLCKMSRDLGPIIVISSCRTRKQNRSVKRSLHLYSRGCKAADLVIRGVSKKRIISYWNRNGGGGTGYYCGRPFVHVDTGQTRSWTWFCKKK